jgi:hypothetical protein
MRDIESVRMKQLDIATVRHILMSMPDMQESTVHGHPSFKTGGTLFACPAIHKSVETNSLVLRIPAAERDKLLADQPHIYYLTDHYSRNAVVLVRLSEIDGKSLRSLLERALLLLTQDRRSRSAASKKLEPARKSSPKKGPTKVGKK